MDTVDLLFPVCGSRAPVDHHYPLYSGLSRLLPCLHDGSLTFALAPLSAQYVGDGWLQLDPLRSRLRLRLAARDIPRVLPLAGKRFGVGGCPIRLGVPYVEALTPSPRLIAHIVTIKKATEPEPFLEAARRKLDAAGVGGRAEIPPIPCGLRRGQPRRQILRVDGYSVVGFALTVDGLAAAESIRLQTARVFGRAHMGGGFFLPHQEDAHGKV